MIISYRQGQGGNGRLRDRSAPRLVWRGSVCGCRSRDGKKSLALRRRMPRKEKMSNGSMLRPLQRTCEQGRGGKGRLRDGSAPSSGLSWKTPHGTLSSTWDTTDRTGSTFQHRAGKSLKETRSRARLMQNLSYLALDASAFA